MKYDDSVGRFYTATDLRMLADQGAKQANNAAEGYSVFVGALEYGIRFYVSSKCVGGIAHLLIEVDVSHVGGGGKATRNLSTYDSSDELLREEVLESIQLRTDGNPTAFVTGHTLSESELIRELVRPVIEAASLT